MSDMGREELIARLRALGSHHTPALLATDQDAIWRQACRQAADELESQHYADLEHEHLGCYVAKTGIYKLDHCEGSCDCKVGEQCKAYAARVAAAREGNK